MLKVSLIKQLFDDRIYEGNPKNSGSDYLNFDDGESFITRRQLYRIYDNIVFR